MYSIGGMYEIVLELDSLVEQTLDVCNHSLHVIVNGRRNDESEQMWLYKCKKIYLYLPFKIVFDK